MIILEAIKWTVINTILSVCIIQTFLTTHLTMTMVIAISMVYYVNNVASVLLNYPCVILWVTVNLQIAMICCWLCEISLVIIKKNWLCVSIDQCKVSRLPAEVANL